MIWDLWLTSLLELPAGAPEWNKASEFVDAFMEIAKLKLEERATFGRRRLGMALHTLLTETGDMLRKFEFEECANWMADNYPAEHAAQLATRVDEFREKLERRRRLGLQSLPEGATIRDEEVRWGLLRALQKEIVTEFSALMTTFAVPRAPTSLPAVSQSESDAEVSYATKMRTPPPEGTSDRTAISLVPTSEAGPQELSAGQAPTVAVAVAGSDGMTSGKVGQTANTLTELPSTRAPVSLSAINEPSGVAQQVSVSQPPTTSMLSGAASIAIEPAVEPTKPEVPLGPLSIQERRPDIEGPSVGNDDTKKPPVPPGGEPVKQEAAPETPPVEVRKREIEAPLADNATQKPTTLAVKASRSAAEPPRTKYGTAPRTGLPELSQVARDVQRDDSPEAWSRFVWALIASDDLTGAYWLALWKGQTMPVQAWLVAAVQGARWLSGPGDPLAFDLLELSAQAHDPQADPMLKLAAGLYPSLVAPESGMAGFLQNPPVAFGRLAKAVAVFSERGRALQSAQVTKALVEGPADPAAFRQAAAKATQWLKESAAFGSQYAPAVKVWRALTHTGGPLRKMMEPVSSDDRPALDVVRHELRTWSVISRAEDRIQQVFRAESGRTKTIVGSALQRLLRESSDAARLAKAWCELVERDLRLASRQKDAEIDVAELRAGVQSALPETELALARLYTPAVPLGVATAAHCVERSFARVCDALQIPHRFHNSSFAERESRYWCNPEEPTLASALRRRLWWLPEIAGHGADGSGDAPEQFAAALRDQVAEGRLLETAFHQWLDLQDYRCARQILSEMEGTPEFRTLLERCEDLLEESRERLSFMIDSAREQVEQGMLDGYLYDERSEYLAALDSIDPGSVQDFPGVLERVTQIRDRLTGLRDSRIEHVMERWSRLEPELMKRKDVDAVDKQAILEFIQSNHDRKDTRVLDECVSRIAEVLSAEGDVRGVVGMLGWFAPASSRDELSEYVAVSGSLAASLETFGISPIVEALKKNRQPLEQFGIRIPEGERREDVLTGLNNWKKIKEARLNHSDAGQAVAPVLHFLGFQFRGVAGSVKVLESGPDWMLVHARYGASDAAPIPQFGSEAGGGYHVLCVWRKAPPGRVKEILKEGTILKQLNLERKAVIVFYLSYRSDAERDALASVARQNGYALTVLDENLLLFLAGESDNRVKTLLRCALPFSALVPYTPNRRGDVAEEMFVGREKMIRDIWSTDEGCIVYGGRQLGKTTIQHRVVDIYHHPERDQFAWWEPMAKLFEPTAGRTGENIWLMFAERMKQAGMTVRQHTPDRIADQIVAYMDPDVRPSLRVLIMLDEADDFLDADAAADFREVRRIRDVMDHTGRRFKVVFAGNRKVQRFQSVQDNPLVHFGTPILVGPLEPDAARQLVRRPLATLGYRMEDAVVLRVLSYTNYHAVCIHQFGEALLRRLRNRNAGPMPELITRADVESAYGDKSVRDVIREIFINTLALEDDYLVTTLAMIRDQMLVRDSFSKSYTANELYALAYDAWPLGFESAQLELDVFRLRLDEMCGLGVLVKSSNGGYFLRSPNMVRMISADGTVDSELGRMQTRVRQPKVDIEAYHAPMSAAPGSYSPLTYAQEKALNCRQTGVALVFASEALGITNLPEVFRRLIPATLPKEVQTDCASIPSEIQDADGLKLWLREYLAQNANHERLVLWYDLAATDDQEGCVRAAVDFCKAHPSEKRWLRIHLVFDPAATWKWCSLLSAIREDLESRSDAVITVRKWRLQGIRKRFEQQDRPATDEICSQVLETTGGWHMLLDALPIASTSNPTAAAQQLAAELVGQETALFRQFRTALGLDVSEPAQKLFSFLCSAVDVPKEYVSPVLLDEYGLHREADCENALRFLDTIGCVDVRADIVCIDRLLRRILRQETDTNTGSRPTGTILRKTAESGS